MWLSAVYVQKELSKLELDVDLRAEVDRLCEEWDGMWRKFADPAVDHTLADGYVRDSIAKTHQVVQALDVASKQDARFGLAYVLVSQSAANVINAYGGWTPPPPVAPKLSHKEWSKRSVASMVDNLNRNVLAEQLAAAKRAGKVHPLAKRMPGPPLTADEEAEVKAAARLIVAMHPSAPAEPARRPLVLFRALRKGLLKLWT
jgi:hypothetical protein